MFGMLSWWKREKKQIEHEGDLTVFREALELAAARREGKESDKRPALLVLSGVLRGVYGGGGVRALERAGLTNGFCTTVGLSTGAPTIAYFLAGQAGIGTSIYYEECIGGSFLRWWGRHIVDVSFLGKVWRGSLGSKKVDTMALEDSPTSAYVSLAAQKTGIVSLHLLTSTTDPIEGVVAACSIPGLYKGCATIGGEEFYDGTFIDPLPVRELALVDEPTSIVVFMNREKNEDDTGLGLWVYTWFVRNVLRYEGFLTMKEKNARRRSAVEWLRGSTIPYCIIYTDHDVLPFTTTRKKLIAAADRFEAYVTNLIEQARVEKIG